MYEAAFTLTHTSEAIASQPADTVSPARLSHDPEGLRLSAPPFHAPGAQRSITCRPGREAASWLVLSWTSAVPAGLFLLMTTKSESDADHTVMMIIKGNPL